MKIERARRRDHEELLEFIVRCFRTGVPDHPRFEVFLPDLYEPTDESMRCHFLIRLNGRIASVVGLYPFEVKIGPLRARVAGIGAVSTAPEHRGKGLMSALLRAVRTEIVEQAYPVSWLSGLRDRYAHFGWEVAGTDLFLKLTEAEPDDGRWASRVWTPADPVRSMVAARRRLTSVGVCDQAMWRLKLRRYGMETIEATQSGRYAYVVVNRWKNWLAEWGGDVEGVRVLLRRAIAAGGPLLVRVPWMPDEYTGMFLDMKASERGVGRDNLAVFHLPAFARLYGPLLADSWPRGKAIRLVLDAPDMNASAVCLADGAIRRKPAAGTPELRLDALQLALLLFGPAKPSTLPGVPAALKWLDRVFPVPFYVPSLWRV